MSEPPRKPGATKVVLFSVLLGVVAFLLWPYRPVSPAPWTDDMLAELRSLSLSALEPLQPDTTSSVSSNPDAVILGNRLFFDVRLSANKQVSCATCHQPDRHFTDGLARGEGVGTSKRNTRSIVGVAYSPWLYWDGRRDSLWAQALSPLEDANEHGTNRMQVVRLVTTEDAYRASYESVFGNAPDFSERQRFPEDAAPGINNDWTAAWESMSEADRTEVNRVFTNLGKAIAAYESTLLPEPTRFDQYVDALLGGSPDADDLMSKDEVLGLQLFMADARCTECHNGPLLTNHEFHNTGIMAAPGEFPDRGRIDGVREALDSEFNCLSGYSDDVNACDELRFVRTGEELIGATRTPSLRNLFDTEPYSSKGQNATLMDVLTHYNEAPDAMIGHNEAEELKLSRAELKRVQAFLETLRPL